LYVVTYLASVTGSVVLNELLPTFASLAARAVRAARNAAGAAARNCRRLK
jgi:hypothetical protein